MQEKFPNLESWMYPFPAPEEVFAKEVELHRKHFLPLISIDASVIDSSWRGKLHIVSAKETCDGGVGENSPIQFHSDLCTCNQVAFHVDNNSKYTFLGDFRFFMIENEVGAVGLSNYVTQKFIDDFAKHYQSMEESFSLIKDNYKKTGFLNPNSTRQPDRKDEWLSLGSELSYFNSIAPTLPNGNKLRFIAQTQGYSYSDDAATSILLWFDPIDRIAITQFDFD